MPASGAGRCFWKHGVCSRCRVLECCYVVVDDVGVSVGVSVGVLLLLFSSYLFSKSLARGHGQAPILNQPKTKSSQARNNYGTRYLV